MGGAGDVQVHDDEQRDHWRATEGDLEADEADGIEAQPEIQLVASEPLGACEDHHYVRGPVSTELRGSASCCM